MKKTFLENMKLRSDRITQLHRLRETD